jgi:serine/threonine-protein kinase
MTASAPPATGLAGTELPPGARLGGGRYAIERLLGRGGFGITYRAEDRRLGRWVAVKELAPPGVLRRPGPGPGDQRLEAPAHLAGEFAGARDRFLREAHALGRFDHPGIMRVYEVFEEGGTAYLICEYLHGPSLAAHLVDRGRVLAEREALDLAAGVGVALVQVHAAGLLHRDVSPSNIVLVRHGDGVRPVLIDFGLARTFAGDGTEALTRMVTPGFAPIEQYGGAERIGPPGDVYGLAATLYHGLAGKLPPAAIDRQNGVTLEPLRRVRPDVTRLVADAVHDGLELDARHRPASVAAFLARLGLADVMPGALRPTAAPTPTRLAPAPGPVPAPVPVVAVDVPPAAPSGPSPRPVSPSPPPRSVSPRPGAPSPMRWPDPLAPVVVAPMPPPPARPYPAVAPSWPSPPPPSPWPWPGPAAGAPAAPGGWQPLGGDLVVAAPVAVAAGRRWAVWPLAILAVALGAAAPLAGLPLLVVILLPVLATVGDLRRRRRHRLFGAVSAPFRVLRNAAVAVVACFPALLVTGGAIAVALVLRTAGDGVAAAEVVLRAGGGAGALVAWSIMTGDRTRFAAAEAVDALAERLLDADGRPTGAAVGLAVTAALAALAAVGLSPDLWPLR